MKRIALFLVVAAIACSGLSYYNGLRLERDFQAGLQQVLAEAGTPGVEIQTDYERGFFQSSAVSTLNWSGSAALTVRHRIAHGPIPWAGLRHGARPGRTWIESELSFGLEKIAGVSEVFTQVPPLRIFTNVGAGGEGSSEFRWPAFEGNSPQSGKISIAELVGEIDFGGPKEQALGFVQWGGMQIESPFLTVRVSAMSGEFAYEDILKPSIYGQSSFELESITAQVAGQVVTDLRDLRWAEQRAVTDGKMFLRSQLGAASLQVTSMDLRELSVESQFENIDISVWEQLRTYAQSVSGYTKASTGAAAATQADTMQMLQTFVAASPSFSMQVSGLVDGQRLRANANAAFGAGAHESGQNLEAWTRSLNANLDLYVPAPLLEPLLQRGGKAAQLRMLEEQGVLRRTPSNAYEMRLQFENGELRVNGVPYEALKKLERSNRRH